LSVARWAAWLAPIWRVIFPRLPAGGQPLPQSFWLPALYARSHWRFDVGFWPNPGGAPPAGPLRLSRGIGNPRLGRERDHVKTGYRGFSQGRHVVFYVIASAGIEVIGIVHRSADVDARLWEPPKGE
jgi:hypothetical protein